MSKKRKTKIIVINAITIQFIVILSHHYYSFCQKYFSLQVQLFSNYYQSYPSFSSLSQVITELLAIQMSFKLLLHCQSRCYLSFIQDFHLLF